MLKQILGNLLVIIVSVLLFITLTEVTFRWLGAPGGAAPAEAFPRYYFKKDDVLGYDIVRNSKRLIHRSSNFSYPIFSNRFGCFDFEKEIPKNYGLVVGDSFTWGYTALESKWTTQLERKSGLFLMKCGVSGYGSRQAYLKAKRIVSEVGHSPNLLLYMYYSNDLNDDILMPQRTVFAGHLVNSVGGLNLVTGKKIIRTPSDIERIYQKYKEGTFSNQLRDFRYSLVTYRLYRSAMNALERRWRALTKTPVGKIYEPEIGYIGQAKAASDSNTPTMPALMKSIYRTLLIKYLDTTDRAWFNKQVDAHQNTIIQLAEFALSLDARFVLVDINGDLTHHRFNKLIDFFNRESGVYYYNLRADLRKPETWKLDAHWNDRGNLSVGNQIYKFLSKKKLVVR